MFAEYPTRISFNALRVLIIIAGLHILTASAWAQLPDSINLRLYEPIASFESASALDMDVNGNLFVADWGADQVVKLRPDGTIVDRWGGPGTGANAFDGPSSIDVTNGLRVLVADERNGRIQWLTSEGVLIGSVSLTASRSGQFVDRFADSGQAAPVAVASDTENEFYVIDGLSNSVLHWTRDRSFRRIVDGQSLRKPAFGKLVALLLDGEQMFVGDRSTSSVYVFDRLGTFERTICARQCVGLNSIVKYNNLILIVSDSSIRAYHQHGLLNTVTPVRGDETLVDVQPSKDGWFILTATSLYFVRR